MNGGGEKEQINEPANFETAIAQTGYGKFNHLLTLVTLLAVLGTLFGSNTISFILPAAQCDLNLSNFDKGTLNAVIYGGMISSPFLWGFLSDNLGRQKLLVVGYLLEGLFALLSSLAQSLWLLQLLRFLVGAIGCGPYAILMTYLAELHASQFRSRVIMMSSVFVAVSFITAPAIALLLLPQPWSWDLFGGYIKFGSWNVFVAVCALPSLLSGLLMLLFSESPKFLMSRGRRDEALEVLRHIYSVNTGKHPDSFPVKELVDELSLNTAGPTSVGALNKGACGALKAGWEQVKPLFMPTHLPMAVLVLSLQMGALFGMNTLRLWMPQIFSTMQEFSNNPSTKGMENSSLCQMLTFNKSVVVQDKLLQDAECTVYVADSLIYVNSMIIGATCGVCSIGAGFLVNAVGKRMLMISCFFVAGACILAVYWSRNTDLTLVLFALYHGFVEVGIICTIGVAVDVFPTSLRAMAVSLTMMFGRLGSLCGNLIFPVLLDLSCEVPFFLVSAILIREYQSVQLY